MNGRRAFQPVGCHSLKNAGQKVRRPLTGLETCPPGEALYDALASTVFPPFHSPDLSVPEPSSDLHDILPGFEVIDFIGRGGMGAVYKACQQSLNRVVALKLLSAHSTSDSDLDFAARFKVEAQAMAADGTRRLPLQHSKRSSLANPCP